MNHLVHIGYPKAASTWLQEFFFPNAAPDFKQLIPNTPKPGSNLFFDRNNKFKNLHHGITSPFHWEEASTVRDKILENSSETAVNVLSNEVWTGHPFSGGITGPIFAERIKAVLPETKILIIVRSQLGAIYSSYSDYLDRGGCIAKLKHLLGGTSSFGDQRPGYSPYYFDYKRLVQHYDEVFGQENVIVVPFELLKQGPQQFVEPIYNAFDIEMPADKTFDSTRTNVRNYNRTAILSRMQFLNLLDGSKAGNSLFSFRARHFRNHVLNFVSAITPKRSLTKLLQMTKQPFALNG